MDERKAKRYQAKISLEARDKLKSIADKNYSNIVKTLERIIHEAFIAEHSKG